MEDGRQRVVRHGHMPERTIQTDIGAVEVRQPRIRDRRAHGTERIRFTSAILPPYAGRTESLDASFAGAVSARYSNWRPPRGACCFARQGGRRSMSGGRSVSGSFALKRTSAVHPLMTVSKTTS
jgi:hypothetical protein